MPIQEHLLKAAFLKIKQDMEQKELAIVELKVKQAELLGEIERLHTKKEIIQVQDGYHLSESIVELRKEISLLKESLAQKNRGKT